MKKNPADIKFAIGIPTLNRADLLVPTLQKYVKQFPNTIIYILDNGFQGVEFNFGPHIWGLCHNEDVPLAGCASVAASWNALCKQIFASHHDYALILNDDICLRKTEAQVKEFLCKQSGNFFVAPNDWCAFIMPKSTFRKIGPFDENFEPAYYEDADYAYRLKQSGLGMVSTMFLHPEIHRDNSTGEKDPSVYRNDIKNKQYYIKKWGGPPRMEKYLTPFSMKPGK